MQTAQKTFRRHYEDLRAKSPATVKATNRIACVMQLVSVYVV